jgi:hypothetical protein
MNWFFSLLLITGCTRPTADYPVQVHADGTSLEDIQSSPTAMGGLIEYSRTRLFGSNLGLGMTGLYGDQPRADGDQFILGTASFSYPADPSYDNVSALVTLGPPKVDSCHIVMGPRSSPGSVEYVDVGDTVRLKGGSLDVRLARDPVIYPRPAGKAWYVEYGAKLEPVLTDYSNGNDNWRSEATLSVTFPGGLPPQYATVGAIPFPLQDGSMTLPPDILDLTVQGEIVRAPLHGEEDDPVRFAGPWASPMELTWTAADSPQNLTIAIRAVASIPEGNCICDDDCGAGFSCVESTCFGDDGSSAKQLGELVCTVADDGSFTLSPDDVKSFASQLNDADWAGSILVVSRINQGTITVPDVLTFNGKRISTGTIRTRAIDSIYTRLEVVQ